MKTGKNLKVCILAAAIAAAGCRQEQPRAENVTTGAAEEYVSRSEYNAMVAAKNATEDTLYGAINDIDNSLRAVSETHGLMEPGGEQRMSKKEQIIHTINDISALLEQNKARIKKLNGQLVTLRRQNKGLQQESAEMREAIQRGEIELAGLHQQVADHTATINYLNQIVNDLKQENSVVHAHAKKMDTELHKAYYALGSYKDLREKNVLEKKGGILGLGRTPRIKGDFEKMHFTEIDTRQVTTIPVNSKKAKLVTHHPVGSYEWEKSGSGKPQALTITDPEKFWATSRYLVVEVK